MCDSSVHAGISSPSVDTTRVALRDVDESVPGSDYINANYIKVLGKGKMLCEGCLQSSAVVLVHNCSNGVSLEGMACQDQYLLWVQAKHSSFLLYLKRTHSAMSCLPLSKGFSQSPPFLTRQEVLRD